MPSRRNIIFASGALALTSLLSTLKLRKLQWFEDLVEDQVLIGAGNLGLYWIDLRSGQVETVKIGDIAPHSFNLIPGSRRVIVVEKRDNRLAIVDFSKGEVERYILAPKDYLFYGHGLISRNNDSFLVTRVDEISGVGEIAEYSLDDFKELRTFQVSKSGLHDLCYLSDGKTLAVTISGIKYVSGFGFNQYVSGGKFEASAIALVDEESGKLKNLKSIDSEVDILTHLARGPEDQLVVVTTPLIDNLLNNVEKGHGEVYFASGPDAELEKIEFTAEFISHLKGENLSVRYLPNHLAVITNPTSGITFAVDLKLKQLKKDFNLKANGVAYSRSSEKIYLSTHSESGDKLSVINANNLESYSADFKSTEMNLYSSHLLLI